MERSLLLCLRGGRVSPFGKSGLWKPEDPTRSQADRGTQQCSVTKLTGCIVRLVELIYEVVRLQVHQSHPCEEAQRYMH
jgi:hypothetical protein